MTLRLRNNIFLLYVVFISACGTKSQQPATGEKEVHTPHEKKIADEPMKKTQTLKLSDNQIQLGNIITDSLREFNLGSEIILTGTLQPNENKIAAISSRVTGRLEKLYFRNPGDEVKRGDILYEIFSEELTLAIKELRLALDNKEISAAYSSSNNLIESARNKLSLYGLTAVQIRKLELQELTPDRVAILSPAEGIIISVNAMEGDYVTLGQSVFQLSDLSSLWFETQLYQNQVLFVKKGMPVSVSIPGFFASAVKGEVTFINPETGSNPALQSIRIEIANNQKRFKPGMQANAVIVSDESSVLAIPVDAVILDECGAMAWVKTDQNTFEMRMVETGIETTDFIEIKSGIKKGEQVVVAGAYLLSSEYAFKIGTGTMLEH